MAVRISRASASGTRSSASIENTQSPVASSSAACFWRPKPVKCGRCTTRAPALIAMVTVSSTLAWSTTTISSQNDNDARQSGRFAASLRVMMIALSLGMSSLVR